MEEKPDIIAQYILHAKEGKQSAYNFLLTTFWNQVYAFQLKRTQDDYEAEEITIQTFSRAFSHLEKYNDEHKFYTWLIAISKNLHIDHLRKEQSQKRIEKAQKKDKLEYVVDEGPTPEDALIRKQNLAELLHFIKLLKSPYQEVINLRYFQEMSYKEMAEQLDEPMSNVKVRLLRARRLLADLIQKNK